MTAVADAAVRPRTEAVGFKPNVHYLRGLAAFSVFLFHSGTHYNLAYGDLFYRGLFHGKFGAVGVAIFFAISGYLMATLVRAQRPVDFLFRRLARIFPLFVIVTAITVYMRPLQSDGYTVFSLALAPIGLTNYPLRVEWTLVNEMFFYVMLFGLDLAGGVRFLNAFAVLWLGAICVNLLARWSLPVIGQATPFDLPLMPENVPFAAGLLLPLVIASRYTPPLLLLTAFVIGTVATPVTTDRFICGLACVCLVAAAVKANDVMPAGLEPVFRKLGDWSYATYLVHVPVMMIVLRPYPFPETGGTFALWIAVVIVASAIFGEIDLWIAKNLRGVRAASSVWPIVAVSAFLAIYLAVALAYPFT